MVVLLLGVSVMVFLISHMVPSNPVAANLSQTALNDPEIVAAYEAKWGLDKPLHEQYIVYMSNLLRGDFGTSIRTGRPVLQDLKQYFPATVELSIFAMIIAIVLGVGFGVLSAIFQNKPADQILRAISVSGVSPQLLVCPAGDVGVLRQASVVSQRGRINPASSTPPAAPACMCWTPSPGSDWEMLSGCPFHLVLPPLCWAFSPWSLITAKPAPTF